MPSSPSASRLLRHARREAIIVAAIWLAALLWTVGYCYLHGYRHPADSWLVEAGIVAAWDPNQYQVVLGVPRWVLFGIMAPWLITSLITVAFSLFVMKDDDLGVEQAGGGGHGS